MYTIPELTLQTHIHISQKANCPVTPTRPEQSKVVFLQHLHSDLPTIPEFPGLSRKRDAYPLPHILVKNSRILCAVCLAHPDRRYLLPRGAKVTQ